MPRLQADLLAPDVLDDLLPQAPSTPRCRRVGTCRLLRASTDRAVVSLLQDLRDPDGRAPRPARHPLSCALPGSAPRPDGNHRPRSFRGVHRQAGSSFRHGDCRRIGIVVRLRHRSRPPPGKREAPRPEHGSGDPVTIEPLLHRKHQTHVSGPDSTGFRGPAPGLQRGWEIGLRGRRSGRRPQIQDRASGLPKSQTGAQGDAAVTRSH